MTPRGPELDDAAHCEWLRGEVDRLTTSLCTRTEEVRMLRAQLLAAERRRHEAVGLLMAAMRAAR
jgi:hypothetical protein